MKADRCCISKRVRKSHLCPNTFQSNTCTIILFLVPGTWNTWGEWGTCSKTCDEGVHSRARNCKTPFPANAGDDCNGASFETDSCTIIPCPGNNR